MDTIEELTDVGEECSGVILSRRLEYATEDLTLAPPRGGTPTGPTTPPKPHEKPSKAYALVSFVSSDL